MKRNNAIPETYIKPGMFSGNRSCIPGLQPGSVEKEADDSDNQWNSEHVDNRQPGSQTFNVLPEDFPNLSKLFPGLPFFASKSFDFGLHFRRKNDFGLTFFPCRFKQGVELVLNLLQSFLETGLFVLEFHLRFDLHRLQSGEGPGRLPP